MHVMLCTITFGLSRVFYYWYSISNTTVVFRDKSKFWHSSKNVIDSARESIQEYDDYLEHNSFGIHHDGPNGHYCPQLIDGLNR